MVAGSAEGDAGVGAEAGGFKGVTRSAEEAEPEGEEEGLQRPRLSGGGRITKREGEQACGGTGRSTFISSKWRLRGLSVATPDIVRCAERVAAETRFGRGRGEALGGRRRKKNEARGTWFAMMGGVAMNTGAESVKYPKQHKSDDKLLRLAAVTPVAKRRITVAAALRL